MKDPITAKRQARPNPPEDRITEEVAELRIVEQELWEAVKARQGRTRHATTDLDGPPRPERARRPRHLFSGLLMCGACGASFTLVSSTRYGCAAARNKGTCDNRRTIERAVLEEKVLTGLRAQLLAPDLIGEFVAEYQREHNRLMQEERAARSGLERELAQVRRKIDQMIDAIGEGMFHPSMKARMTALEARQAELEAELREARPEPVLALHPGLSNVYRAKVAELTTALNDAALRTEAAELLRGLRARSGCCRRATVWRSSSSARLPPSWRSGKSEPPGGGPPGGR